MIQKKEEEKKSGLRIREETWMNICKIEFQMPQLKLLALEGATQCELRTDPYTPIKLLNTNDGQCKVYQYSLFSKDQNMVIDFMNEYSVMKQAFVKQLSNVIQLSEVRLGFEHVSLYMPTY